MFSQAMLQLAGKDKKKIMFLNLPQTWISVCLASINMLTTFRRRLNRDFDTMITRLSTDFSRGRHNRGSLKVGWNGGWMAVIKSLCAFLRSQTDFCHQPFKRTST